MPLTSLVLRLFYPPSAVINREDGFEYCVLGARTSCLHSLQVSCSESTLLERTRQILSPARQTVETHIHIPEGRNGCFETDGERTRTEPR